MVHRDDHNVIISLVPQVPIEEAVRIAREHHRAGRLEQAEKIYRLVLEQRPNHPNVLHVLGIIAHQRGRHDEGIELCRHAIERDQNSDPGFRIDLARIYRESGRPAEALAETDRALALRRNEGEAMHERGMALRELNRFDEAVETLRKTVEFMPNNHAAFSSLGIALRDAGKVDESLVAFKRAIEIEPKFAVAYINMSAALKRLRRFEESLAAAEKAVQLEPLSVAAHNNLATSLLELGQPEGAADAFRKALSVSPNHPIVMNNLANALREQGEIEEAIDLYRGALKIRPDFLEGHSNLLFALHYDPRCEPMQLKGEHAAWGKRFAEPLAHEIKPHANDRNPNRRLRVGFVSADFRQHPVGRFLRPIFEHCNAEALEIICFSDTLAGDAVTNNLRERADAWFSTAGLSDAALADLVRRERIDILIDLAAHAQHHRLQAFARKPAPVQMTYLGYPGTTGVGAIDYRITDPHLDPPGNENFYTEKSLHLPRTYWCYSAPPNSSDVNELPATQNGYVTFGCLNKFSKASKPCLTTWGELLRAIPKSRMLIHCNPGRHRDEILASWSRLGVNSDRVEFMPNQTYSEYLRLHQRIDIALDPFPYAGGTTTCDALWMGVPVITLAGKIAVHRAGVSLLNNVGLPELVAKSPQHYVEIASAMAGDASKLSNLRAGLRERMLASPLTDQAGFARDIESVFRKAWINWCERADEASPPPRE